MGQTLTHGIYLPDEGERNCYNGLAGNWSILDGAVGTVAEHTSALAGKAPLVHTHTKSDITDFPVYGTTAGTICEGNDSRLSDARAPVAHTHSKSDVTDLFNSANEWTGAQTYSAASYGQKIWLKNTGLDLSVNGNTGLSDTYQHVISWADKNNTIYSSIQSWASDANNTLVLRSYYRTDANTSRNLSVRFTNTATDKSVYPETNGDVNLGTSANQWNNLYAKNYYYNGVAWGLDKSNIWTATNNFSILSLYNNSVTYNEAPSSNVELPSIRIFGGGRYCGAFDYIWKSTGENVIRLSLGSYKSDGTFGYWACNFGVSRDFSDGGKFETPAFYPNGNNAYDLGTQTNKWKTLNGINPGALSLPNTPGGTGTVNVNYYDLSGNITVRDGSTYNRITAPCDGWIAIGTFATWLQISNDTLILATTANPGADGFAQAFLPVRKGNSIRIVVNQTNTQFQSFKLLPCEGNV